LTWISPKKCYGVFEVPLLSNAQKRHKTISKFIFKKTNKSTNPPLIGHLPDIRRFQKTKIRRPLRDNYGGGGDKGSNAAAGGAVLFIPEKCCELPQKNVFLLHAKAKEICACLHELLPRSEFFIYRPSSTWGGPKNSH
jgi:hypothetical protein